MYERQDERRKAAVDGAGNTLFPSSLPEQAAPPRYCVGVPRRGEAVKVWSRREETLFSSPACGVQRRRFGAQRPRARSRPGEGVGFGGRKGVSHEMAPVMKSAAQGLFHMKWLPAQLNVAHDGDANVLIEFFLKMPLPLKKGGGAPAAAPLRYCGCLSLLSIPGFPRRRGGGRKPREYGNEPSGGDVMITAMGLKIALMVAGFLFT